MIKYHQTKNKTLFFQTHKDVQQQKQKQQQYEDDSGHDQRSIASSFKNYAFLKNKKKKPFKQKYLSSSSNLSTSFKKNKENDNPLLLTSSSHDKSFRPRSSSLSTCSSSSSSSSLHDPIHNESFLSASSGRANHQQRPPSPTLMNHSDFSVRVHQYQFDSSKQQLSNRINNNIDDDDRSQFSFHITNPVSPPIHASSSLYSSSRKNNNYTPFSFLRKPFFNNSNKQDKNTSSSSLKNNISTTNRRHHQSNNSIKSQVFFMGSQSLPAFETVVFCSLCEKWVQSRLRYKSGTMVWLASFVLLMCTVVLFWIPFYIKYFKDIVHYCPNCSKKIGRHCIL